MAVVAVCPWGYTGGRNKETMDTDGLNICLLVLAVFMALIALGVLYRFQFSKTQSLSIVILVFVCITLLFTYFVIQHRNIGRIGWGREGKNSEKNEPRE